MPPLNLIFMGTPAFALPSLKTLVEAGHTIKAVYTQPPRPAGRGQKEKFSPVYEYALSRNLPVYTPASLREPETQQEFAGHKADAAIVAAYGLLLPKAILAMPRMGCLNVHPSLLPRWRGAAPIQRTIMAGDKETGIVIMQMDAGLDTGDILLLKHYSIADGTTAGMLHDTLAELAGPMLVETLQALNNNSIAPVKQSEEGIMYAQKITKDEACIDWKQPASILRQKILGLNIGPAAYFIFNDETIKILHADSAESSVLAPPGTVLDNQLTIACGTGALRPTLLQRAGKKPLPAKEMLRGFAIPSGTVLS